jgi:hypothetical protein
MVVLSSVHMYVVMCRDIHRVSARNASELDLSTKKASAILNLHEAKYRAFATAEAEAAELPEFRAVHSELSGGLPVLTLNEKRLYRVRSAGWRGDSGQSTA